MIPATRLSPVLLAVFTLGNALPCGPSLHAQEPGLSMTPPAATSPIIYLDAMDPSGIQQDNMGAAQLNRSVKGNPITMGGRIFERGIGSHARSEIPLALGGEALRLRATVGIVDETQGKGTVQFRVVVALGPQRLRHVWRQEDIGIFENQYSSTIAAHGCVLIKPTEEQ